MSRLEQRLLWSCCCCLLLGNWPKEAAAEPPAWQPPTAEQVRQSLDDCRHVPEPGQLRCVMRQLGVWTDEGGFQAKRIARIFSERGQTEELLLVIEYCNSKEWRPEQPAHWANEAYSCATAGTLGTWVAEFMEQIK